MRCLLHVEEEFASSTHLPRWVKRLTMQEQVEYLGKCVDAAYNVQLSRF